MKVIEARNVHQALPKGLQLLRERGVARRSRNGEVLVAPWPVTTVYERPWERVVFWAERDINIAFLIYEAFWMLAGRKDVEPLTRYVHDFGRFSDDGQTLHGAYGYRWRAAFGCDQLPVIAKALRVNPEDRRCVLQMWDAPRDLGSGSLDVPCNDMATFQRNAAGALELTVFCRSNDVLWGAYFANAFHFGMLLEYMALAVGCAQGVYRQASVNYHVYTAKLDKAAGLVDRALGRLYATPRPIDDPYAAAQVIPQTLCACDDPRGTDRLDAQVATVLADADGGFQSSRAPSYLCCGTLAAHRVLRAHHRWRHSAKSDRYELALEALGDDEVSDWAVAMRGWLGRRQAKQEAATV